MGLRNNSFGRIWCSSRRLQANQMRIVSRSRFSLRREDPPDHQALWDADPVHRSVTHPEHQILHSAVQATKDIWFMKGDCEMHPKFECAVWRLTKGDQ